MSPGKSVTYVPGLYRCSDFPFPVAVAVAVDCSSVPGLLNRNGVRYNFRKLYLTPFPRTPARRCSLTCAGASAAAGGGVLGRLGFLERAREGDSLDRLASTGAGRGSRLRGGGGQLLARRFGLLRHRSHP